MPRRDCFALWRTLVGVTVWLCLALLGVSARATVGELQQARPMLESAASSHVTPAVTDCVPCAGCYVAPAPSAHGFGGESKEPDAPGWRPRAERSRGACSNFGTSGLRTPLPVRIAFCRWLV